MLITGQFNDSLPPIMDGVAITAANYAYWLNKKHGPSFAVGPKVPDYVDDQENILRFMSLPLQLSGPYRLGMPRIDRSFNKIIDEIPFDLVHAHCPFVSGNYAYHLASTRKIPMVATFHSKYRDDFASIMKLDITIDQAVEMVVRFYEKADAVWVPNEGIIETFRDYGFKGDIDVIPNGSDIGVTSEKERRKLAKAGSERLHIQNDKPVLLYVGQHRWVKNLKMLLQSLKILKDSGAQFNMRFVGSGSEVGEMKHMVKKTGLTQNVEFIGPIYERDALREAYAAADLFVFPSMYDNASLATREAAGLKVPTLFCSGATTAKGIEDGKSGFLGDNETPKFAEKLKSILEQPDLLKSTGDGAHSFLYMPWEEVADIVNEKYEEIVDRFKTQKLKRIVGRNR